MVALNPACAMTLCCGGPHAGHWDSSHLANVRWVVTDSAFADGVDETEAFVSAGFEEAGCVLGRHCYLGLTMDRNLVRCNPGQSDGLFLSMDDTVGLSRLDY